MGEKINLKQVERNVFRDYFKDGLFDIVVGTYLLLIGLMLPMGTVTPFIALFVIFSRSLLRRLKKRFTYPRTGYVELRQGDPQPLPRLVLGSLVLGLIALVAVLIAAGVIARPGQWYQWIPIFLGILLAGVFLGLALRARLARYYVIAGIALIGGPTAALLPLTGKLDNIGICFDMVGAVLPAWGVLVFVRFLRKHPLPTEEVSDVTN